MSESPFLRIASHIEETKICERQDEILQNRYQDLFIEPIGLEYLLFDNLLLSFLFFSKGNNVMNSKTFMICFIVCLALVNANEFEHAARKAHGIADCGPSTEIVSF